MLELDLEAWQLEQLAVFCAGSEDLEDNRDGEEETVI